MNFKQAKSEDDPVAFELAPLTFLDSIRSKFYFGWWCPPTLNAGPLVDHPYFPVMAFLISPARPKLWTTNCAGEIIPYCSGSAVYDAWRRLPKWLGDKNCYQLAPLIHGAELQFERRLAAVVWYHRRFRNKG